MPIFFHQVWMLKWEVPKAQLIKYWTSSWRPSLSKALEESWAGFLKDSRLSNQPISRICLILFKECWLEFFWLYHSVLQCLPVVFDSSSHESQPARSGVMGIDVQTIWSIKSLGKTTLGLCASSILFFICCFLWQAAWDDVWLCVTSPSGRYFNGALLHWGFPKGFSPQFNLSRSHLSLNWAGCWSGTGCLLGWCGGETGWWKLGWLGHTSRSVKLAPLVCLYHLDITAALSQ